MFHNLLCLFHSFPCCSCMFHNIPGCSTSFCHLPSPSMTFYRVPGCSTEFYHTMEDSCVLVGPCGSLHALSVIIFGVVVMWLCAVLSSLGVALCGCVDELVWVSTCVRAGYNVVWVLGWSGGYIIILQMLQIFTMLSACSTTRATILSSKQSAPE